MLANAIAALVEKESNSGASAGGKGTPTYIVQFNTNGGSAVANQTIKRGRKITKPENPTKEEYTFLGWYADKYLSTAFDFETAVEKSMTLYAKWQKDEQTPDVPQWNNPFTDVKETNWFYENVKYAVINGLMNGTTDTAFEPNSPLTRAMLVTVLWRPDGKPEANASLAFTVVEGASYYAEAVRWANENGIVLGTTDSSFVPDSAVTREQVAAILMRYAVYKGKGTDSNENLSYSDAAEISDYAQNAVRYCREKGIMQGRENHFFAPKEHATRAEIAAVLQRFFEACRLY